VSGLDPKDAESESCSVGNVGAQTGVWGAATAFAGIVAMVGLGVRRRRNRR
jgi:MYXO-CTERM domain-containing protein